MIVPVGSGQAQRVGDEGDLRIGVARGTSHARDERAMERRDLQSLRSDPKQNRPEREKEEREGGKRTLAPRQGSGNTAIDEAIRLCSHVNISTHRPWSTFMNDSQSLA